MRYGIGFVILHYNAYESTINTIESIVKNCMNCFIVIVDNNSPNSSGDELEKKYKYCKNIKVIKLKENLGFAKGNNVGYMYLREQQKCEFICIMNNDVLILQDNFYSTIKKIYDERQFSVLGPHIIRADGSENEFDLNMRTSEQLHNYKKDIKKTLAKFESKFYFLWSIWWKISKKYRVYSKDYNQSNNLENVLLHGCCLVFSNDYISKFENAFYSKTFLYMEEELLYLKCKRNNMKTYYCDKITVKHLEDIATNSVSKNNRVRELQRLNYLLDSLNVVLSVLNNPENKLLD